MRISDWSSDVCSSDLGTPSKDLGKQYAVQALEMRKFASMADGPAKLVAIDAFVQTHWQSFMNTKARELETALRAYSNGTTQRKFRTKFFLARLTQLAVAAFTEARKRVVWGKWWSVRVG